jgi:parvulin-like peptidyl-prolyl isomerase
MTFRRPLYGLLLLAAGVPGLRAQSTPLPQDNLNLRFADGIVAVVEDHIITVDQVRREIAPYIPQLQRDATNEQQFNQKLEALQNSIIQQLIDRQLIIKEFNKDNKRHIPDSFIDERMAEDMENRFDNDRSKFLAYLRDNGETMKDYREKIADDIIYEYMREQKEHEESVVSPVQIEEYYKENKDQFYQQDEVHLRLIQFTRAGGVTNAELMHKADEVLARFHDGVKFSVIAHEVSQGGRRGEGGDWGWHPRSDLKPEFADAAFALKKGQCTAPIINSDGCFVLYVEDRKYAGIQPLDAVRAQIEAKLMNEITNRHMERWLERLRREGYVKYF